MVSGGFVAWLVVVCGFVVCVWVWLVLFSDLVLVYD